MKKEKFKYLYSFRYNDKQYIYLVSKNYPFYFLEYNSSSNGFDYPDFDTFKELYNKFYANDFVAFDIKKNLKEVLHDININIAPLVRTTSGLLSVAIVLSMCGCNQTDDIYYANNTNDTEIVEVQDRSQDIYDYFKSYDMDVINKNYDGEDYIFANGFINSSNKYQITLQDFDEFRNFTGLDFIPSWDDVGNAFMNNKNIDEEKRSIIMECLNNMRNCEELSNLDLSVLYINAQRMNFQYLSSEEMINTVGRDSVYAYFDTTTGTVYLPSDKPLEKFEFIHEVLGHGTLSYREENENSLIVFDCTNYLMLPTDDRYTGYSVGIMVSEGGANMIAHLATNDYSVNSFYKLYEEELRAIAQLCHVSIGEMLNHKGISLYDLMYSNGINTPVEYIFQMDGIYKGQLYCEFSDLMERLFIDATEEEFVNSSPDRQNEIISDTINIIHNSYFRNEEELYFNYNGGAITYNFDDSAQDYESAMNQMRGK